jgi:nitroimidazol reductase NimA-like FMN-containing flavoprotein (pyridoxamine 5'-phosphate oxidase superfamily)
MSDYTQTERTRLRRAHERGTYDRDTIHAILDAGFLCHVGFQQDGQTFVTPTLYWREGERVMIHGSSASRTLRALEAGAEACLTVTHMDGFVMARSAFHHSANFRSVMLLGKAALVTDRAEKTQVLKNFVNGLFPGRWDELRPMTEVELKATSVLAFNLNEVSAKVRTGGPIDDEEDYALPIWAGVIPTKMVVGEPVPDDRLIPGTPQPDYVPNGVIPLNR